MAELYKPYIRFGQLSVPINPDRCRAETYEPVSRNFSQCARKKVIEVDGIGYCKQHSPEAAAARRAARAAKKAEEQKKRDRVYRRPGDYMNALREIAEVTKKQQLPITSQIHTIATEALAKWGDLETR